MAYGSTAASQLLQLVSRHDFKTVEENGFRLLCFHWPSEGISRGLQGTGFPAGKTSVVGRTPRGGPILWRKTVPAGPWPKELGLSKNTIMDIVQRNR